MRSRIVMLPEARLWGRMEADLLMAPQDFEEFL
jgi:hypothetical protein